MISGTGLTYSGSFPNIHLTGGTINSITELDGRRPLFCRRRTHRSTRTSAWRLLRRSKPSDAIELDAKRSAPADAASTRRLPRPMAAPLPATLEGLRLGGAAGNLIGSTIVLYDGILTLSPDRLQSRALELIESS